MMKKALDDAALDILFREARSYNRWSPEAMPDKTLHALYELLKWGPTSANCSPARFVFVTSAAAKTTLVGCVSPGNVIKVEQAPVTVIIGMDEKFYEKIPFLFPHRPQVGDGFKDPAVGQVVMMRNSSLQGAYLILAARSLGLDCGPMSGFDNAKVDAAFFGGTSVKSNFICALGVGTTELLYARSPRLPFDEACKIV
jgi:3-hydroxypropanoate dehydrogenase